MVGFSGLGSIKYSMLGLRSSWIWMVVVSILDHWFFRIGTVFRIRNSVRTFKQLDVGFSKDLDFSHWGQGFSKDVYFFSLGSGLFQDLDGLVVFLWILVFAGFSIG